MSHSLAVLASQRHLVSLLRQRVEMAPVKPLLVEGDAVYTAEALLNEGGRVAGALVAAGLNSGDRVALQCGNRAEFLTVFIGCALAGMVLVPINSASRGSQLAYYVKNSRARIFITEAALINQLENALAVEPGMIDGLDAVWSLDPVLESSRLPRIRRMADVDIELRSWSEPFSPAAHAIVMYTSGTSGPSKGVLCSHAQLYWWGHHSLSNLGIRSDDVLYTCLPLFHVNALNTFYQAILSGGTMVVGKKFSVSRFYEDLKLARATVTYLLGAMVPMLLSRAPDASERSHSVRIALAPGASEQHYESFETRTGILMLDGYGSTESNFVICTPIHDRRPGWMGKVVPGFQARVVDADDNELPDGTAGELVLRNDEPFAFSSGYFEMPEKSTEVWRNLWFHTGDRVVRDKTGYYRFLDRIKDSIRRRGENISSFEVEQALGSHPSVADVAAFAVPSELAEDEVMCALVLHQGQAFDPLALIRWCEQRLPYFAIPRYLRAVPVLPKTENGKVQKYKLRSEGKTVDTWDIAFSGHVVKR